MSYTPRPGSIAEASIKCLSGHGRMRAVDLARTIDADPAMLYSSLNLSVAHGLLERGMDNAENWYALPSETIPVAEVTQPESDIAAIIEQQRAFVAPPVQASPATRHFAIGLFSDGRFVIELENLSATLNPDETERLFSYIEKIGSVQ